MRECFVLFGFFFSPQNPLGFGWRTNNDPSKNRGFYIGKTVSHSDNGWDEPAEDMHHLHIVSPQ